MARHIPVARGRFESPRPMVSFTFDDAAASSGDEGAAALEEHGGRGTYYIASGIAMSDAFGYPMIGPDRIRELHHAGHEIGLHSHMHKPGGLLTAEEFARDLNRNREWLRSLDDSIEPTNFAYPHGYASYPRKRQLRDLVSTSRSIIPGVIRGVFDAHLLPCVELAEDKLTLESLGRYLDEVERMNGWLILCSHDISEAPTPYGCNSSLFKAAVKAVAERGVAMVTVAEALRYAKPLAGGTFTKQTIANRRS